VLEAILRPAPEGELMKSRIFVASLVAGGSLLSATGAQAAVRPSSTCTPSTNGYGRLFPTLPASTASSSALNALANATIADAETPTPEGQPDSEENQDILAGYTYFGQFVDHDLTLDDRPNDLTTPTDVTSLVDLRTEQLDLDSVYLNGPTNSPQLYDSDHMHLLVGNLLTGSPDTGARDLPRSSNGQAIIGDPRNDENRIVAGIHSTFIRLHNLYVDQVRTAHPSWNASQVFDAAKRQTVWSYQSIVINDFLPQIVGQRAVDSVLTRTPTGYVTHLGFYNTCAKMPVEFSVAAYRFGHSMVRGVYRINSAVNRLPIFSGTFGTPGVDLTGFTPAPSNFGIDWSYFVNAGRDSTHTPQPSYKIDASLTNSLSLLPLPVSSAGPANLALRNLLRAQQLSLPSGQAVARAIGVAPLPDDQILVGKATGDVADAQSIVSLSPEFANNAPLWTYILAEATAHAYPVSNGKIVGPQRAPFRLGPVGGRIVAETIIGLLASDPNSILNQSPSTVNAALSTTHIQHLWDLFKSVMPQSTKQPTNQRRAQAAPAKPSRRSPGRVAATSLGRIPVRL